MDAGLIVVIVVITALAFDFTNGFHDTANVVAIELLSAAQGIDFHRPLRTSEPLERVVEAVRVVVPFYDQDRFFAPDIAAARALVGGEVAASLTPGLLA